MDPVFVVVVLPVNVVVDAVFVVVVMLPVAVDVDPVLVVVVLPVERLSMCGSTPCTGKGKDSTSISGIFGGARQARKMSFPKRSNTRDWNLEGSSTLYVSIV